MITHGKWHIRFLKLAQHVAQWSKDESTQVGCVIADKSHRIISVGFNGPPSRTTDGPMTREVKLRRTIHAEANALHFAKADVTGCSAFVTHPPCSQCTAHLIQRGIAHILFLHGSPEFYKRWADDIKESQAMCKESDVTFINLEWEE